MAFHDTHRGCNKNVSLGPFCNNWGNGTQGNGLIPDWTPVYYDHTKLTLPYWIPCMFFSFYVQSMLKHLHVCFAFIIIKK